MPPSPNRHNTPETIHKGEWISRAACLTKDPELFFPDKANKDQIKKALAVCALCDVQYECLESELEQDATSQHGIFGGMTEDDRKALIRKRLRKQMRSNRNRFAVE